MDFSNHYPESRAKIFKQLGHWNRATFIGGFVQDSDSMTGSPTYIGDNVKFQFIMTSFHYHPLKIPYYTGN